MKKLAVGLLGVVTVVSLAGNLYLFQRYSTSRPILQMGSDAVSIKEYRDSLEHQAGKIVLTKITLGKIVLSAAKKKGVYPTDKDVDRRLADLQRRAPGQLEAARQDSVKMAELRRDLRTDLALENITIKETRLSEAEIRAFYAGNKRLFALPTQSQTLIVVAQNRLDAATAEALLRQKNVTPAAIATTQPRLGVVGLNYTPDWNGMPGAVRARLSQAVNAAPVGSVVKVPVPEAIFVVRIDRKVGAGIMPYDMARPEAERLARLAKAPHREVVLGRLYRDAHIHFEIPHYADYFQEIEAASK